MKCQILHRSRGRLRVRMAVPRMTLGDADALEYYLRDIPGVTEVQVFDRTRDAVILFSGDEGPVLRGLARYTVEAGLALVPEHTSRALNREYEDKLAMTVFRRVFKKLFFPAPLRWALSTVRWLKYLKEGAAALLHGQLSVAVLDAAAVTASILRGDFDTAGSVMFMLNIGEILEDWTHKKSVADLAGAMSLNVDKVWLRTNGTEVQVPLSQVHAGDEIVVRTGGMIPLDGRVVGGEASVNQASITGESLPVLKREGSYVYAGTVLEEGECVLAVDKAAGSGRYDRPAGALYPGGRGPGVALHPEHHQDHGRPHGGFFLRPQAVHAHRRPLRHAGELGLSHLRQGRPLFGSGGPGRYHRL